MSRIGNADSEKCVLPMEKRIYDNMLLLIHAHAFMYLSL